MPSGLNDELRQQINAALFSGNKIEAIRIYRDATQCRLAEASEFILALDAALRKETPDAFEEESNTGCAGAAAMLLLILFTVGYFC